MNTRINAHRLLAKTNPPKPLWQHMVDVGYVTRNLLHSNFKRFLKQACQWTGWPEEETTLLLCYIAAMHDIGKAHPLFQEVSLDMRSLMLEEGIAEPSLGTTSFRHEKYSERLLSGFLRKRLSSRTMIRNLPAIDALHHQGKSGNHRHINVNPARWEGMQAELEEEMYNLFCFDMSLSMDECKNVDAFCTVALGLVILSDWIASGEMQAEASIDSISEYAAHADEEARQAITRCGLGGGAMLLPREHYQDYWPWLTSPRPLQTVVDEMTESIRNFGLMLIEAPMGEGKSEAALYAAISRAAGERGIYFALPTSATSNQMYKRTRDMYSYTGGGSIRLLHSMAWLADNANESRLQSDGESMCEWLMPLRKGLLSSNAVGTVDQVMLSIMNVKYGAIRLAGLFNKVLVIDEVHAYDMYMSQIICRLLRWCAELGIPVILLSATLPDKKKRALVRAYAGKGLDCKSRSYPLVTCVKADGTCYEASAEASRHTVLTIECRPIMGKTEPIARACVDRVAEGGCLCLIVNTVEAAQNIYLRIRSIAPDDIQLYLWHARFPAGQRADVERDCDEAFSKSGKRPEKAILVATQVAEQSCDYSFDFMFTELAPIDLLLQRSGRLHRHQVGLYGKIEPKLVVLTPQGSDYGATGYVYRPYLLDQTVKVLETYRQIRIPEDMRAVIGGVYDDLPETETEEWLKYQFDASMEMAQGEYAVMKPPASDRFGLASEFGVISADNEVGELAASTRLGEPSVNVIFLDENNECSDIRTLLMRSCSLRQSLTALHGCNGYADPQTCEGRLRGYCVFRTKQGTYEGVRGEIKLLYRLDDTLGLVVKRGDYHGI